MDTLGDRIKFYREQNKISKSELSRRVGVSPAYITMLENGGKTNPSLELQIKLAEALNTQLNQLLSDSSYVNLTGSNEETRKLYTEVLAGSEEFDKTVSILKNLGYEVIQDPNTYKVNILKDGKPIIVNIPENEFIEISEKMLDNIKEFTEFQVYKIVDHFDFIGGVDD